MEHRDKVLALFREHDANGDGTVSLTELKDLLTMLGMPPENLDKLAAATLDAADSDRNGSVSYTEFVNWVFAGACVPEQASSWRDAPAGSGLVVNVLSAANLPSMDVLSGNDTYVAISVLVADQPEAISCAQSSIGHGSGYTVWNEAVLLEGDVTSWSIRDTAVKFELRDRDTLSCDDYIGEASIQLEDLLRYPSRELLVTYDGDAVLSTGVPRQPCFLNVSADLERLPEELPRPVPQQEEEPMAQYPKHIFMMSRGTRGDVQPFVALARGMAEQLGWLVTICTELRWRSFVRSKTQGLSQGKVRFLPCGGDTTARIDRWEAKWVMSSKTEVMQSMMLAFSEAEFFSSGPVFAYQVQKQHALVPIDLIVAAFTLTGIAMLVSEYCAVPMVGFILQPTCIPSADPNWKCVADIDAGNVLL